MWQFVTIDGESEGAFPVPILSPISLGVVTHALTHRRYEFEIYLAQAASGKLATDNPPKRWVTLEDLANYPLPRPHLKIVEMLSKAKNVKT